jgi:hypothetical protein
MELTREEDRQLSEGGIWKRLMDIVGRRQNIGEFKEMQVTPWLREHLKVANMADNMGGWTSGWTCEHLEGGFLGAKLENPEEAEKCALRGAELEEFISLLALYRERRAA